MEIGRRQSQNLKLNEGEGRVRKSQCSPVLNDIYLYTSYILKVNTECEREARYLATIHAYFVLVCLFCAAAIHGYMVGYPIYDTKT